MLCVLCVVCCVLCCLYVGGRSGMETDGNNQDLYDPPTIIGLDENDKNRRNTSTVMKNITMNDLALYIY